MLSIRTFSANILQLIRDRRSARFRWPFIRSPILWIGILRLVQPLSSPFSVKSLRQLEMQAENRPSPEDAARLDIVDRILSHAGRRRRRFHGIHEITPDETTRRKVIKAPFGRSTSGGTRSARYRRTRPREKNNSTSIRLRWADERRMTSRDPPLYPLGSWIMARASPPLRNSAICINCLEAIVLPMERCFKE